MMAVITDAPAIGVLAVVLFVVGVVIGGYAILMGLALVERWRWQWWKARMERTTSNTHRRR